MSVPISTYQEPTQDNWTALAKHPDNPYRNLGGQSYNACVALDVPSGEVWQWMGFGDFRHRCHPATGQRIYIKVTA